MQPSNPTSTFAQSSAVAEMYLTHYGWIHSWLCKKLRSSNEASDLTHDTFICVMNKKDLSHLVEPRAYLTTIAHGLMVNHVRRRSLEQAYLDALSHMPESNMLNEEERLILLETLQEIDDMLSNLSTKVRHAFLLSQLEGMRYQEIAIKLNVNERTVKRYMAEAFTQCLLLIK